MKFIVAACFCAFVVYAQQPAQPEPGVRRLPADILRDFPGACFASTACRVFQVNETWPLFPFCGRATCLLEGAGTPAARLVEFVEDCGQRPKESPGCKAVDTVDPEAAYPACCPQYLCEQGKELLYYTEAELKELSTAPPPPQGAGNPQQAQAAARPTA